VIKFACSKCGRKISVDDKHAGKKGKCPACGEPVVVPEASNRIKFHCAHCGQSIKVPKSYAGKKGKCPKCKESIDVPTRQTPPAAALSPEPQPASEPAPEPIPEPQVDTEAVEEDYGEDIDAPPRPSVFGGPDRRLIMILGGAAALVVVAAVAAIIFLKFSGSEPTSDPSPRRTPRRSVEDADSSSRPADRSEPAPVASAESWHFAPAPGTKRTMRVTTQLSQSVEEGGRAQQLTATETVGFDLEVMPPEVDGTIPLKVSLATVKVVSAANGTTLAQYDSTKPEDDPRSMGESYTPFIGKPFTISVSSQGEIVAYELDELYAAAAAAQVHASGGADRPSGPSEQAVLAIKKQLEQSSVMHKNKVMGLLDELVLALPPDLVEKGLTWRGSVGASYVDRQLRLATVYTVVAVEDDHCAIQAKGHRSQKEDPVVQEFGPLRVSYMLGGSSDATLVVDRQTGWLSSKERKTSLSGQFVRTMTQGSQQDSVSQTTMEITTTVTLVE